jgi:tetratricopeptide (TPR) repeat protein
MSTSGGDPGPACWICYECAFVAEAGTHSAGPLLRACACRGPDASFSHLPCLIKYAGANDTASGGKSWRHCPTCKQDYTGELQLGLARGHWELVRGRAAEDAELSQATGDLATALQGAGDFDGALPLAEEVLAVARRIHGDDHPDTLTYINNLANLHSDMGNHDLALPLYTEALAGSRRLLGDEDPAGTLVGISNLASVHSHMGNNDLALPLCKEALAEHRRVLGNAHPDTLTCIHNMALVRDRMGEHVAAATLLREALAGRRRVLGEDHPHTQATISWMDRNEEILAAEVAAVVAEEGEEEGEEEEETMYQRLAKRHRARARA